MKRRSSSPSFDINSNTNIATPLPPPQHVPHVAIESTANHASSESFRIFITSLLQSIPITSTPLLIADAELARYALAFITPTPPPAHVLRLTGSDALALAVTDWLHKKFEKEDPARLEARKLCIVSRGEGLRMWARALGIKRFEDGGGGKKMATAGVMKGLVGAMYVHLGFGHVLSFVASQLENLADQIFDKYLAEPKASTRPSEEMANLDDHDTGSYCYSEDNQFQCPPLQLPLGDPSTNLKNYLWKHELADYDITYSSRGNSRDVRVWTASISVPNVCYERLPKRIAHAGSKKDASAAACQTMLEMLMEMERSGFVIGRRDTGSHKRARIVEAVKDEESSAVAIPETIVAWESRPAMVLVMDNCGKWYSSDDPADVLKESKFGRLKKIPEDEVDFCYDLEGS